MTVIHTETLWPGELAYLNVRGRRALVRITKRNPKTYTCVEQDGQPWKGDHRLFTKAPADTEWVSTAPAKPVAVRLNVGTVVRFKPTARIKGGAPKGLWVVANCDRESKCRLFELGGSTRYYTGLTSVDLDVVPVSEINA